jgi:nucleotide-binding universal stress UspA family protein
MQTTTGLVETPAMPAVILAVLDHPPAAPALLNAAYCLTDLVGGARVEALIARTPPIATILPSDEVLTKHQEDSVRAREATRAAALTDTFQRYAAEHSIPGRLIDIEALATQLLTKEGPGADYIVIARPKHDEHRTTWNAIHTALFETDRPVLVVPPGPTHPFGRRVALAWRNDERTIRAALSLMHCLRRLECLLVLAGHREGAPMPQLPAVVVEHQVPAELNVLPVGPPIFGEALLARAHELDADMIALGAYVHDPLHRLILGGVTDYMLEHADLPLLMRH